MMHSKATLTEANSPEHSESLKWTGIDCLKEARITLICSFPISFFSTWKLRSMNVKDPPFDDKLENIQFTKLPIIKAPLWSLETSYICHVSFFTFLFENINDHMREFHYFSSLERIRGCRLFRNDLYHVWHFWKSMHNDVEEATKVFKRFS